MAIIPQPELFSWSQVDAASDMDRLHMVLGAIPDEALMRALEASRKGRRDDYPVRAVWNSILAGVVFEHASVESLRRELSRNAQLREACGFDLYRGAKAVPPSWVYTRFLSKLMDCQEQIDAMFDELVETLRALLPGFGTRMAIDSKAIESHGNAAQKKDENEQDQKEQKKEADGRRDSDADWGVKTYRGQRKDGSAWEKVKSWFGYKLHLIVDSDYELPVAYKVTKASVSDCTELLPLVDLLDQRHPGFLKGTDFMSADKGYDSTENNRDLWDLYGVKPIVDIRSTWKEDPELPRPLFPEKVDTVFHTEDGRVMCRNLDGGLREQDNYTPMVFEGFEAYRECLKYRCPAAAKGVDCTQRDLCNGGCHTEHGRIVRIALDTNRRTFTPQARDSNTWDREYKHRSAIERVNSRIAGAFGFERHFIRGMRKMRARTGLALVVMLAVAVGRIRANQSDRIRSLVSTAAA